MLNLSSVLARNASLHGFSLRAGLGTPLFSTFKPGKFGRLFPALAPLDAPDTALDALGAAMVEPNPGNPAGDNLTIPAGFTYLGQFVDHDITFDTTTLGEVVTDPQAVRNFRTPRLDLDSLYGQGPTAQPYLYQKDDLNKFALGLTQPFPQEPIGEVLNDLPRDNQNNALIGDPRNDENLIVAQLHLAFLKFHNQIVEELRGAGTPVEKLFSEARRLTTWHYQWIVLHDFIKRLVDPATFDDVMTNGRKFFQFADEPFMPLEFSVAAYRLGHSMVREQYEYNDIFSTGGTFGPASLSTLFSFTGGGGAANPLPNNWIIDWRRFFDLPRSLGPGIPAVSFSRKLDALAVPELHTNPMLAPGLPIRNLRRGKMMQLPSGQAVAAAMKLPPLPTADLASGTEGAVAAANGLHLASPLWYYVLKEAASSIAVGGGDGQHLGKVGSRIVMEVFVGLLEGDDTSYLSKAPEWTPTLKSITTGEFTMVDLIRFVNDPLVNGST